MPGRTADGALQQGPRRVLGDAQRQRRQVAGLGLSIAFDPATD